MATETILIDSDSDLDLCDMEIPSEKQLSDCTIPTIKEDSLTESRNLDFQTEAVNEQRASGSSHDRQGEISFTTTTVEESVEQVASGSSYDTEMEDSVDGHLKKPPEQMSDLKEIEGPDLPEYDSLQEYSVDIPDSKDIESEDLPDIESPELPDYDSLHEDSTTGTTHPAGASNVSDSVNKPASRKIKGTPKTHRPVPYAYKAMKSAKSARGKQPATEKGLTNAKPNTGGVNKSIGEVNTSVSGVNTSVSDQPQSMSGMNTSKGGQPRSKEEVAAVIGRIFASLGKDNPLLKAQNQQMSSLPNTIGSGSGNMSSGASMNPGTGVASSIGGGAQPVIPGPNAQGPNELQNKNIIWRGQIEWQDKTDKKAIVPGHNFRITRSLGCTVSIAVTDPDINTTNWPRVLMMQLIPQTLLNSNQLHPIFKNSRHLTFHFQNTILEDLKNLYKVLCNGFAGCVHFPPNTGCDVRVLLLLYSTKKKSFKGLIPNDQTGVVNGIRHVITEHKQRAQLGATNTNPLPRESNQLPRESNPLPKVSNPLPKVSNPLPKVSNPLPKVSNPLPKVSSPLRPSRFKAPSPAQNVSSTNTNDAKSFQNKETPQAKTKVLTTEENTQPRAAFSVSVDVSMICEACSTQNSHNSMVECCVNHVICTQCVEKAAKAVLKRENKGFVGCSKEGCTSSIPPSELKKALPGIVLDLLEECWKEETLEALEDMNESVRCPSCDLPALLDMAIKRFKCTQCKKFYCRYCEMEWHLKSHDLCIKTKSRMSKDTGTAIQIPAHWPDDCDKAIFTTVELDTKCHEFKEIEQLFKTSMTCPVYKVYKIYRIQNVRLWDRYCLMRSHMMADLEEMHLQEMRLFHGTAGDVVDAICREGFDWRLSGKNGTAYGKGTYFAKSASYSNRYCGYSSVGLASSQSQDAQGFTLGNTSNSGGTSQQNSSTGFNFGAISQPNVNSGFNFGPSSQQNPSPGSSQQNPSSQSSSSQLGSTNPGVTSSNTFPVPNFFSTSSNTNPPPPRLSFAAAASQLQSNLHLSGNAFPLPAGPSGYPIPSSGTSGNNTTYFTPITNPFMSGSSGSVISQNVQLMFVGRVLVGRTCQGNPEMRRPVKDPDDPEGKMCHTAVDNLTTPYIFVTFDNAQCYPEYLIQY